MSQTPYAKSEYLNYICIQDQKTIAILNPVLITYSCLSFIKCMFCIYTSFEKEKKIIQYDPYSLS